MNLIFKNTTIALLAIATTACATKMSNQEATGKYLEKSRNTALEFRAKLGDIQKEQLAAVGAENALPVCKKIAPAMAAEYSKDDQVLKRVSLKPRNQTQGTPDAWEKATLESFNQAQQAGKPVDNMEASTVSHDADGHWFRYMKAIPTQAQCLQCHGKPADISAGMKVLLAKEYPNDKATGYSVGEVRGAISIKHQLDVVAK